MFIALLALDVLLIVIFTAVFIYVLVKLHFKLDKTSLVTLLLYLISLILRAVGLGSWMLDETSVVHTAVVYITHTLAQNLIWIMLF